MSFNRVMNNYSSGFIGRFPSADARHLVERREDVVDVRRATGSDPAPLRHPEGFPPVVFIQLNLQRSKLPMTVLNDTVFDIALVQEPNITKKGVVTALKATRRWYSKGTKPRAGIILNNNINYWPIEPLSSRDLTVVALDLEHHRKNIYVASSYLDIADPAPSMELDRLTKFCKDKNIPLILGIDANAHSTMWGEELTNRRGGMMEEWLTQQGLQLMNRGRTPTFCPENGTRSTIIDITVANAAAANLIADWKVNLEEASLSDHRMISYVVQDQVNKEIKLHRNLKKVKWAKFKEALQKISMDILIPQIDMDEMAEAITDTIAGALDAVAPKHKLTIKDKDSWWTESLNTKRKILRNLYSKRLCHPRVLEKYRQLKKDLRKEIESARRDSWRQFCSKADSAKDISKIVQILENPPRRMMSILTENEELLAPDESLNHLLKTHFPDGQIVEGDISPMGQQKAGMDMTGICQYINVVKIKAAFTSFGDHKSPGPDGIPPIALKNLPDNILEAG